MAGADNGMRGTRRKAVRDEEEMNRDVKRKALSETRTYSVTGSRAESPRDLEIATRA